MWGSFPQTDQKGVTASSRAEKPHFPLSNGCIPLSLGGKKNKGGWPEKEKGKIQKRGEQAFSGRVGLSTFPLSGRKKRLVPEKKRKRKKDPCFMLEKRLVVPSRV